jgi:tRNA dimethylallyltransferase
MPKINPKIIVICGPTATGKTNLALSLAGVFKKSSIISVDSRQSYQYLDILTGKDIPNGFIKKKSSEIKFQGKPVIFHQFEGIRLWGIDLISPEKEQNLSDFVQFTWSVIEKETKTNRQIILVGGTGLYLKGITENLETIHIPQDSKLRSELEKLKLKPLQNKLINLNKNLFNSLNHSDQRNPRRLIRHIEITLHKGKIPNNLSKIKPQYLIIGLKTTKKELQESILKRVKKRLAAGVLVEIKTLQEKYKNQKLHIYSSLGVNHLIDYLNQKITRQKLIENWTQSEIAYAKRQITWFKKQRKIIWYDKNVKPAIIIKKVNTWLKK